MSKTLTINAVDRSAVWRHFLDNNGSPGWVFQETAFRGEIGTGSVVLDDTTTFTVPAMKAVSFDESDASQARVWTGYVDNRDIIRGPLKAGTDRQWVVELEDVNALWDDQILLGSDSANRPAETDYARMTWLISTSALGGATAGSTVPSASNVDMDAIDYRGSHPRQVAEDCAQKSGKNFFLYRTTALFVFYALTSGTTYSSTLKISDDPADVDSSTVFAPIIEGPSLKRDSSRVYSGVRLLYKRGAVYERNATTATNFRTRETSITNMKIKTSAKATQQAQKWLAKADAETDTLPDITIKVPAANVNDIRAGQRMELKLRHAGITSYTYYRVRHRAITPVDDISYKVRLTFLDDVRVTSFSRDILVPEEMSNATDDDATIIIDSDVFTITDGAISVQNNLGQDVLTAAGLAAGTVAAAQVVDGALTTAKFAAGIRPVDIVAVLPTLPDAAYPEGSVAYLTTDDKLYRSNGTTWSASISTADLSGVVGIEQLTATIQEALANDPMNMVRNGGGEEGTLGAQAAGWTAGSGNGLLVAQDGHKYGTRALKLTNTVATDSFSYQDLTVEDGVIYVLSGWIATSAMPTADTGWGALLNVDAVSGVSAFTLLERVGNDPGNVPDVGIAADDAAHDWTFVKSRFIPTGSGVIRLYLQLGLVGNQSGSAWFDGVRLARESKVAADDIIAGAVTTLKLAANAVTAAKIAAGTITSAEIASDTIVAGNIAAGAISTSELAALAVTAAKIAAGTITANEIAALTITAALLAASSVTSAKIASGAITAQHIAVGTIADNMILNPSAEGGIIEGWGLVEGGGTLTASAVQFQDGAYSFALPAPSVGYGTRAIPVVPGEKYKVRVWVKGASATGAGLYVRLQEKDTFPSGGYVTTALRTSYTDIFSNTAITTSWVRKEGVYTVPAGIYWVSLSVYNWAGGPTTLWFDNASLSPVPRDVSNSTGYVIINESGITVTNGSITVSNAGGTVVLDGTKEIMQIVHSSTLLLPKADKLGDFFASAKISTGLTYDPATMFFVKLPDPDGNTGDWSQQCPYYKINVAGQIVARWGGRARVVDGNKTQVQAFQLTTNPAVPLPARSIRYYIMNKTSL